MNSEMTMGLVLIIAAVVLLAAGEVLLFIWRKKQKKM